MTPIDIISVLTRLTGATAVEARRDGLWMAAPLLDVRQMAGDMYRLGARLSTISAVAQSTGETEIIYHYLLNRQAINIKVQTKNNALPSITPMVPSANWIEREIHDLYNVNFIDHPNLARLIRPRQLKNGLFREPGGAASRN